MLKEKLLVPISMKSIHDAQVQVACAPDQWRCKGWKI